MCMMDARTVNGNFLINKHHSFTIFSFLVRREVEKIESLLDEHDLYFLFKSYDLCGRLLFSPLFAVEEIKLIPCEATQAVANIRLRSSYAWLSEKLPFIDGVWSPRCVDCECVIKLTDILREYTKQGWMRTPFLPFRSILIAQEENEESVQELKEVALGYLFLNEK